MRKIFFTLGLLVLLPACSGKGKPVDAFSAHQTSRISEGSAYRDADFDFWAAAYEPTTEDFEAFRAAWIQHGQAFPESKNFEKLEAEAEKSNQTVLLASLYMTAFEYADLSDKTVGWAVHPVPQKIIELPETDEVLRAFMPVKNSWARYFMVIYPKGAWTAGSKLLVSNRHSKVELNPSRR